jgi:hypothetical protein
MKDVLSSIGMIGLVLGHTLSLPLGLWAAITRGAVFHGFMSVFVPFYGLIYWVVS